MNNMNNMSKLKYKIIAYGIAWIWVIAILNQYIDIDGWILYPISATGVFLLIVVGAHLVYGVDNLYQCYDCNNFFHKLDKKLCKDGGKHSQDYCEDCYDKKEKNK